MKKNWREGNSKILDNAQVFNNVKLYDCSTIKGNAIVKDTSWVRGSRISGNVELSGDCYVGYCNLSGNIKISGRMFIYNLKLSGSICLHSDKSIIICNKKDLKKFVSSQDKTDNKALEQIMTEELSIFNCGKVIHEEINN